MAEYNRQEDLMFDELTSDEESGEDERLDEDEMKEMELDTRTNKSKKTRIGVREAKCDSKWCVLSVVGEIALYLCYICDIYLCEKCVKGHNKMHELVRVESEESERERMGHKLLGRMRSEGIQEREFYEEKIKVYGRVNVKHGLDKEDCRIYGLCGLQDKRWVVLDSRNYCMKIFSSVTNTLLRYVRFGSRPWDATEIKQKFTDPNSASGSKSDVSGATRGEQDKHCLLAVTFPYIKQICFIDVNQSPAVKTKTIKMQKQCLSIDVSEDKIFTFCEEVVWFESRYSVDILSAEGNPLKEIQTYFPYYNIEDLAVYKDRIYLTDLCNNKVLCKNVKDEKTVSQLHIEEGSRGLRGISVDPSNSVVYVCGYETKKVYKLSPDLRGYEQLNLDTDYIQEPVRICFTDDKLFVGHDWTSSLRNFVTVVQLT